MNFLPSFDYLNFISNFFLIYGVCVFLLMDFYLSISCYSFALKELPSRYQMNKYILTLQSEILNLDDVLDIDYLVDFG